MAYIGRSPADAPLTSADIADGVITAPKIATDAVETVKVKDLNVTNAKIANDAVGVAELSATGVASASTYLRGDNAWSSIAADTNDKVSVSVDDTTPGYLNGKLVGGTNITLTEGSGGADETLTAALTGTIATARLGTGIADATTFLRGDQTYAAVVGGSQVLIHTTTISGSVANVDITSIFTSTYKKYIIDCINIHAVVDYGDLRIQAFSSGGSPDIGSNYRYYVSGFTDGSAAMAANSTGNTFLQVQRTNIGNAATESGSSRIWLDDPAGTTYQKNFNTQSSGINNAGAVVWSSAAGTYTSAVAITGLRFTLGSGNMDGGIIKIYGIT